ncbi:MAG: CxxC-x17-CxxC domain-containing protein [Candidatus Levyibacteriota bacterium]
MAYPSRDNRSGGGDRGGRRDFGGSRDFGRDRERPQMHSAVCANCGKEAQVPFRPTGSRPVYCSDCFEKMSGGEGRGGDRSESRGFERRDDRGPRGPRPSFDRPRHDGPRPQAGPNLNEINAKLDKILRILEPNAPATPKAPKPQKREEVAVAPQTAPAEMPTEGVTVKRKRAPKKPKVLSEAEGSAEPIVETPAEAPTE